jgi:hypothetical protein
MQVEVASAAVCSCFTVHLLLLLFNITILSMLWLMLLCSVYIVLLQSLSRARRPPPLLQCNGKSRTWQRVPHCPTDPFSILLFTERKPRSSWCQPWFGAPLVRHPSAGATTEGRRRTRLSTALPRHWSTVTARAGHPRRPPACHLDSGSLVVPHGMLGSSFFKTVHCAANWRDAR